MRIISFCSAIAFAALQTRRLAQAVVVSLEDYDLLPKLEAEPLWLSQADSSSTLATEFSEATALAHTELEALADKKEKKEKKPKKVKAKKDKKVKKVKKVKPAKIKKDKKKSKKAKKTSKKAKKSARLTGTTANKCGCK